MKIFVYVLSILSLVFSLNINAKSIEKKVQFVKLNSVDEIVIKDLQTGKNVEISLECVDENEMYDENRRARKEAVAKLTSILKSSNSISIFIDEREEYDYNETFDGEADAIVVLNDKNTTLNQEVINLGYGFVDREESNNPLCREFNIQ